MLDKSLVDGNVHAERALKKRMKRIHRMLRKRQRFGNKRQVERLTAKLQDAEVRLNARTSWLDANNIERSG